MPWQERTVMAQRQEVIALASREGATISALCESFGISRQTGGTWLSRASAGDRVVADHSRRSPTSPVQTPPAMAARILALRGEHPSWGGRKLHHRPRRQGVAAVPAPSTITAILRRHGLLTPESPPRDVLRCEHPVPNDLWQMDFMGHRAVATGRVHPLTLLDDHFRFALLVEACRDERQETVRAHLTAGFRRDGLPRAILTANGSPWATAGMGGDHRAGGLAAAPRHQRLAWPSRSSPDPRQSRTPPRRHFISRGLVGEPVAIRPTRETAIWDVVSGHRQVATIDLNTADEVEPMSPQRCHLSLRSALFLGMKGRRRCCIEHASAHVKTVPRGWLR